MIRPFLFTLLTSGLTFAAAPENAKDSPPAAAAKGAAAAAAQAPQTVRLKFVPAKKGEGRGASGTDLSRKSFDPQVLTAMIDIGLNDSFPIVDEKGRTAFTLKMTEGDDQHVVFEVSTTDGIQKVGVVRDDPSEVTVAGTKYELRFPTVTVNATSKPTTSEAMIFVKQLP